MTKEALIKWYDSGAENRDEFITLVEQALAQQEPNPWSEAVTDQENEKFSMDVSTFSGADPEATKYALEQFLRNRAKEQPAQEPVAWYLSEDSNILGVEWSRQKPKYGRDWTPLYKTAPTQPALSESQITSIAYNCNALPEVITDKTLVDFVRAIEAHCRGGQA